MQQVSPACRWEDSAVEDCVSSYTQYLVQLLITHRLGPDGVHFASLGWCDRHAEMNYASLHLQSCPAAEQSTISDPSWLQSCCLPTQELCNRKSMRHSLEDCSAE